MRAEIAAIPDGRLRVRGRDRERRRRSGRPLLDPRRGLSSTATRSSSTSGRATTRRRGPATRTFGVTASAVYNAMLHLTEPDIPRNSGCYRPIRILARPGSVVNVLPPGPEVGGNSEISPRIVDLLFAALAPAVPDRVAGELRRHRLQLPLRRRAPGDGRVLRQLPHGGLRLGRAPGRRRQQRAGRDQRQLPQHADRGLRDAVSVAGQRACALVPDSGGRRTARGGLRRSGCSRSRPTPSSSASSPTRTRDAAVGPVRRPARRERRDARARGPARTASGPSARRSGPCRTRSSPALCSATATRS